MILSPFLVRQACKAYLIKKGFILPIVSFIFNSTQTIYDVSTRTRCDGQSEHLAEW
jgi:hypothetical protein